jgi:hypothetical protein
MFPENYLSGQGQIDYSANQLSEVKLVVSLFDGKPKELLDRPVCDFIERLMLELILLPNNKEVVRKLNEYKVSIQDNGIDFGRQNESLFSLLKRCSRFPSFTLQKMPREYAAIWESEQGEQFTILFHAERELIEGTNKREADKELIRLLEDYKCEAESGLESLSSAADLEFIRNKNI